MRVLVIEDYDRLRNSLVRGLRENGYAVDQAADGEEGLAFASSSPYDVIVLDLMLPRRDGFEVLKELRKQGVTSRILVLTARETVRDRVRGLDLGADDYLTKPSSFEELMARVRSLQRRAYQQVSAVIHVGDLEIDTAARVARRAGEPLDLTAREYGILEFLAARKGEVVTREEISSRIYDLGMDRNSNVVDVYMGYIRKKLERDGRPRLIHTRRGLGYMLAADAP
jgi:Response regulators consisting of a CheY-like receiver domain and a winged-helix DNA-binding domain